MLKKAHAVLLSLVPVLVGYSQGSLLYDQQSSTNETFPFLGIGTVIQQYYPLGQSFTPALTSVGFIRLKLKDNTTNGVGAVLYVNLRTDSVTGAIIASTLPVAIDDGSVGPVTFFFSENVQVIAGTKYYFDIFVDSGDLWRIDSWEYAYLGGNGFAGGLAYPGSDLWFREGVFVPEPSSAALLLLGLVGWAYRRRLGSERNLRELRTRVCTVGFTSIPNED